ncbi:hypothetical protein [Paraburkholderia acidisoli]|uniref:Transmembrane protein n=1 Tax=Paraburkholderia acidisoli TaxID=2571748 RepID=A0A7Z2GLT7_9BURK|nr:hypothetical protein [Paraburkholderia acidisoli]QGZ64140.1 hypothetical protein FAZ98_20650 [Paraburkholderia acidisoli]
MQPMTFMECVKRAWASAAQAAASMPLLMLGTFFAYAALGGFALAGRPVPDEGVTRSGGLVLLGNLASIVNALIYLWFTLKVSRFVLLGERTKPLLPAGAKPLLRLFAVGVMMVAALAAVALALWLILRPQYQGGAAFLGILISVIWIFVAVRLSLLFPSIATGGPIAFGAAWRDSRGHFWNLFGVVFVAALPVVLAEMILLIGLGIAGASPGVVQTPAWIAALAVGQSIGNIVFALLTTTALAWLYRRYGDALTTHAAS